MFTKQELRTYGPRVGAVLLAGWGAYLALYPPTIVRTDGSRYERVVASWECEPPIALVFTETIRDSSSRSTPASESADQACRDRAIGSGVAIGLLGTGVALLLGFARPMPRREKTDS
ncbi:hypothetical protein [Actinoplanes couchii]|uniref:hypothetical protein n=1 Tax=Actinoplanes couchii TaxID=403638 RepID=UPI0019445ED3|nr:hypothetical protein [Actinoplanes couchii]MDR6318428.1 hypothetical protein [Actinoplanes couchii]